MTSRRVEAVGLPPASVRSAAWGTQGGRIEGLLPLADAAHADAVGEQRERCVTTRQYGGMQTLAIDCGANAAGRAANSSPYDVRHTYAESRGTRARAKPVAS